MKASRKIAQAVSLAAITVWSTSAMAQTILKAANTNDLTDPASWVGGVVPGSGNVAAWDNTVGANSVQFGSDLSVLGLQIGTSATTAASGAVTISSAASTLTLGGSGIDMTNAGGNTLTINAPVALGANQTWTVPTTLTVGSTVSARNSVLTKAGAGTVALAGLTSTVVGNGITANAGLVTIGGTFTPTGAFALSTINTGTSVVFTGLVNTGSNVFSKTGAGLVSIGSLSYTGTTVPVDAAAGTLSVVSPVTFSVPTTVNSSGGTVQFNAQAVNGSNLITKTGAGTVNFAAGLSSFTSLSAVDVQAGTLTITQPVTFATAQNWSNVPAGATLNIAGAVNTSNNAIVKNGAGTIVIGNGAVSGAISTGTGTVTVNAGTLTFNGSRTDAVPSNVTLNGGNLVLAGPNTGTTQPGLGTYATVTFNGGTLQSTLGSSPTLTLFNNIVVPAGQTGTIVLAPRTTLGISGASTVPGNSLTGGGVLNIVVNAALNRQVTNLDYSQFTGTIAFTGGGQFAAVTNLGASNKFSSPANATLDVGGNVSFGVSSASAGTTIAVAYLSGSSGTASLVGPFNGVANPTIYQVGNASTTGSSTYAGQIVGNSALTKAGPSALILTGQTLSYSGATTISGGRLQLDGLKSGVGSISVASGATLAGSGTVSSTGGPAVVLAGGIISPGSGPGAVANGVGVLTLNALNLSNGATGVVEFNATSNDLVAVNTLNLAGVTNLSLYAENTTTAFNTNGSYNLISYNSLSGTPANAFAVPGGLSTKKYTFGTTNVSGINYVTLTIADNLDPSAWRLDTDGNWDVAGNWVNGVAPALPGSTAIFGTPGATFSGGRIISLNGANRTVGTIRFTDPQTVTINGGSNSLVLDNAGAAGSVQVTAGNPVINAGVTLTSLGGSFSVSNAASTLTFSRPITGAGGINVSGPGTVVLGAPATYGGTTLITSGTLRLAGGANTLPATSLVQVSGVLDLNGTAQTVSALSGGGSVTNSGSVDSSLTITDSNNPISLVTPITDGPTNRVSVTLTGATTVNSTTPQGFSGGLTVTQPGVTFNIINGAGLGAGPVNATDQSSFNITQTTNNPAIFFSAPVVVPSGGTVYLAQGNPIHGFSGAYTTAAGAQVPGTVTISGGTQVSLSGTIQQFPGTVTLNIPGGQFLRWSASTGLNNGGTGLFAQVDGTMTTRNNGTVTLGALAGGGSVSSGTIGNPNTTATYVIGGLNLDTVFTGSFSGGDATHFQALTKTGTGTLRLAGPTSYAGPTTVNGGTLVIGNGNLDNTGGSFPTGNLVTNGLLVIDRNATLDIPATVSGTGSLTVEAGMTATFSGNTTYAGNTTVNSARVTFQRPLRPVTGSLVVTGPGAVALSAAPTATAATNTYTVAGEFAGLTISSTGSVTVPAADRAVNNATTLVTTGLSIASGGVLDLGSGDLIVRGGAANLATIRSYFASGALTASAASTANFTTLALFVNDGGAGLPFYSSYDGISGLAAGDLIAKFTYVGDTNLDGRLDGTDLGNVIEGLSTGRAGWAAGDVDNSGGVVNLTDLQRFLAAYSYYGTNNPGSLGAGTGGVAVTGAVPEPTALGLLAVPAAMLTRRRRTR